jgi:aspartate kinase
MIATSEIKIRCVVPQDRGVDALKAAHSSFNLAGTKTFTVPA